MRWGLGLGFSSFKAYSPSRTFRKYQAVLDGQQFQLTVQLESQRFDFGADLVDGHPLGFILRAEGTPFRKFYDDQTPVGFQGSIPRGDYCRRIGKFVIRVGDENQIERRGGQVRVIVSAQDQLHIRKLMLL